MTLLLTFYYLIRSGALAGGESETPKGFRASVGNFSEKFGEWGKVSGTEVVVAVDWGSICFAGYLATLEVVLSIVCLMGVLLVRNRSWGSMQQHCPPEVVDTHRCNGNYMHIYRNAWLEFVENYGSAERAELGFWVPSAELL
ncbi:hypothetical protein PIB30_053420 [Stylosanthes scabra]|uniref:Uncharacterized protein n=1 Tax=Stylosanthes scabra TaxID=79078 RepID=A0ABU6YJP3_9FABA|nr:hypothetical protein [Stylosanthes scabra]